MSLLAPLFLIGALAVALPIWLHRLQTQSADRKPFSSAMLLETTDQRVHVRRQLKYLLLLAFRVLLLLLAAFAFARPFIERPPAVLADTGAGSDLIVIDASLSMSRSGVFGQALATARAIIDESTAGSLLQLLVADTAVRQLAPPSPDKGTLVSQLERIEPGEARVDVGELMAALESRIGALPAPVRLHFVSDFQASAMPSQFADVIPAGVTEFLPHAVGTGDPVNWTIAAARQLDDGLEVALESTGLPDRTADVELWLNGERVTSRAASGPGRFAMRFDAPDYVEGDNVVEIRLLTDDDIAADNRWYLVVRNDPPRPVPLITRNPGGLPATYLSTALESVADARYRVERLVPGQFDTRVLSRYSWLIVDDLGSVDQDLENALDAFLQAGGNLLAFAGDAIRGRESLPVSGRELAPADLGSGMDAFREIASIDDRHPALARSRDWYRVRVSQSVALEDESGGTVIARLNDGAPFIIEENHGRGRLLLLLSGIDNRWNDLPVHAVFVSFMLDSAHYLSGQYDEFGSYTVGDTLSPGRAGSGQIVGPQGESLLSLADTATAGGIRLENAGIYEVYTAEDESRVAVNVDPRESELVRVSQDVLDRWVQSSYSGQDTAAATREIRNEPLALWPWFLLALAVLVIAESALGNVHIATRMKAAA